MYSDKCRTHSRVRFNSDHQFTFSSSIYFIEGSHFSSPELNKACVIIYIIIISGHILCRIIIKLYVSKQMLNSLVNSLSITFGSLNMARSQCKNDPVKYKTVRHLLCPTQKQEETEEGCLSIFSKIKPNSQLSV